MKTAGLLPNRKAPLKLGAHRTIAVDIVNRSRVIICLLLISIFAIDGASQTVVFDVANQPVDYSKLTKHPGVFLVEVIDVNKRYQYCKCILNGKEIYVEPNTTLSPEDEDCYMPIESGKCYLMALAFYHEEITLLPVDFYDFNVIVKTKNGFVNGFDLAKRLPKPFIAMNMSGISIRPIRKDDMNTIKKPLEFVFHPGIPSLNNFDSLGILP